MSPSTIGSEPVMEATEEAILNAMCMARPMSGINDNFCPALPLGEVRRFINAFKPIFASVKKKPQTPSHPADKEKPETSEDRTVTVRERDSLAQERVGCDELVSHLAARLAAPWKSPKLG